MNLSLALGLIAVPLAIWIGIRLLILTARLKELREKEHRLSMKFLAVLQLLGGTLTPEQLEIMRERMDEIEELQAEIADLNSKL